MALKATVFKADVEVADIDRAHYADYRLTLARHPSETDERMMVRLLAFALFADPALAFANGLCVSDEADLWQLDDGGRIVRWIEVGQPEEKRVRKACARAEEVVVLAYGRGVERWWQANAAALGRLPRLRVIALDLQASAALAGLSARKMELQFSIQDGMAWVSSAARSLPIELRLLDGEAAGRY